MEDVVGRPITAPTCPVRSNPSRGDHSRSVVNSRPEMSRNSEESAVNVTTPANHGLKTFPTPRMWGQTNRVRYTILGNVGSNQSRSLYHSRECGVEPIVFAIPFSGMWGRTNRVCHTILGNVGSNHSCLPYQYRRVYSLPGLTRLGKRLPTASAWCLRPKPPEEQESRPSQRRNIEVEFRN